VATGQLHSVRDFCACAFEYLGLDYREFVRVEPSFFRPQEAVPLVGDASKARRVLGWAPRVEFEELVKMMVEADMQDLSGQLVNKVEHV
jgi:GDPmannose 4,6-dehydratase